MRSDVLKTLLWIDGLSASKNPVLIATHNGTEVSASLPGICAISCRQSMGKSISTEPSQTVPATGEFAPTSHSPDFIIDLPALFRDMPVITVLGRVQDWTLHWAGRISCTLRLSIGSISVAANRDTLPLEIQDGSWVRARLELNEESSGPATTLLSASVLGPDEVLAIEVPFRKIQKNAGAAS